MILLSRLPCRLDTLLVLIGATQKKREPTKDARTPRTISVIFLTHSHILHLPSFILHYYINKTQFTHPLLLSNVSTSLCVMPMYFTYVPDLHACVLMYYCMAPCFSLLGLLNFRPCLHGNCLIRKYGVWIDNVLM